MNVDVDIFGPHLDEHRDRGITPARDQRVVGLGDRPLEHPVAHRAPVDESENHPRRRIGILAHPGDPEDARAGALGVEMQHPGRDLRSIELAHPLQHRGRARQVVDDAPLGDQFEGDAPMGDREARDNLGRRALLGGDGLEELKPRRGVEKKLADFDSGAGSRGAFAPDPNLAAVRGDLDSGKVGGTPRDHPHPRDARDRGQRLAAKAHRADRREVARVANLGGRMAAERQDRVLAAHPAAVVADRDKRRRRRARSRR